MKKGYYFNNMGWTAQHRGHDPFQKLVKVCCAFCRNGRSSNNCRYKVFFCLNAQKQRWLYEAVKWGQVRTISISFSAVRYKTNWHINRIVAFNKTRASPLRFNEYVKSLTSISNRFNHFGMTAKGQWRFSSFLSFAISWPYFDICPNIRHHNTTIMCKR